MSAMRAWLDERRPLPPPEMAAELRRPSTDTAGEVDLVEAFGGRARARLEAARARPAARDSAWELLAADALITYACEAALELDDPDASLVRLLSVGGLT